MIPVSELTPDQAVLELEQLADSRPPEDLVLDRIHWDKANLARLGELEAWILAPEAAASAGPPETCTPEPKPTQEIPMPKANPQELLAKKIETYLNVHAKLVASPGAKNVRDNLNTVRHEVRSIAEKHGLSVPDLPAPPKSPFGHHPRKEMKAEPHRPVKPTEIVAPVVPPAAPSVSVSRVRREVWLLLAAIEDMTPEERVGLEYELGLLDAAAHSAYGLATGRVA